MGPQPALAAALRDVPRWRLWSERRSVVSWVLVVELIAILSAASALATMDVTGRDIARVAVLGGLALIYAQLTGQIERLRRYLSATATVTMTSVWSLAAAVALPVGLADLLVLSLYAHGLLRSRRTGARMYRLVFSAATVVLACHAGGTVLHAVQEAHPRSTALGVTLAGLVLELVNFGLVAVVTALAQGPQAFPVLLRNGDERLLEVATLALGALTGLVVLHQAWLSWLVLPLMLALQRSAAVRQLQIQAATDPKTGLLNSAAWQDLAVRQLSQAGRERQDASLLLIDLDHFKRVNDDYGHLAGDEALRAVARCLRHELRDYDSVGRFGGEEFVALLPGVGLRDSHSIAERVRIRIAELPVGEALHVSVSVGVASFPIQGATVDDLLRVADQALYMAKRAGRNRVVTLAEIA